MSTAVVTPVAIGLVVVGLGFIAHYIYNTRFWRTKAKEELNFELIDHSSMQGVVMGQTPWNTYLSNVRIFDANGQPHQVAGMIRLPRKKILFTQTLG